MFSNFGSEFEILDHKTKHPLFLFFSAWKLGLFHCFLITKKTKNEQKNLGIVWFAVSTVLIPGIF